MAPRWATLLPDRYEVQLLLSHGAHAEVWRGMDRRHDTPVAFKVETGKLTLLRFEQQYMRTFGHDDHLLSSLDWFTFDKGKYRVLILPLMGPDLDQVPPTVSELKQVTRDLKAALKELHVHGLLYRDFKPANVLWKPDKSGVVLADFGLALPEKESVPEKIVVGTEPFVSEAAREHRRIGYADDWESLDRLLDHWKKPVPKKARSRSRKTITVQRRR